MGLDGEFGDRLALLRRHVGRLTQEEAAARCGLNPKTWATWELGGSPQHMDEVVIAICEGLTDEEGRQVDPGWLMWGFTSVTTGDGQSPSRWMVPDGGIAA